MTKQKKLRADNTYIITTDSTDNPKLGAKILSNGRRESLFLDSYLGFTVDTSKTGRTYKRVINRRQFLKLYLFTSPQNAAERQHNKETLALAKKIRYEKSQQLLEVSEGYLLRKQCDINFLDFFAEYISHYQKKDRNVMRLALNRFCDFLQDKPECKHFTSGIKPRQLTKEMMLCFAKYLQSRSKGGGAKTIFQRFKTVINHAIEQDVLQKNPCQGVTIVVDNDLLRKDILSAEEIRKLIDTHYDGENAEVRRAFIFCLYCGLRFCDVRELTFANIDVSNQLLRFEQNKTKGHSANSGVVIHLNHNLFRLIGATETKEKNAPVFALPSYSTASLALKKWVTTAGISKHITWHCARHSFATKLVANGVDIRTVASLLGHSGLAHTSKYTHTVDRLKADAINSLDFGF